MTRDTPKEKDQNLINNNMSQKKTVLGKDTIVKRNHEHKSKQQLQQSKKSVSAKNQQKTNIKAEKQELKNTKEIVSKYVMNIEYDKELCTPAVRVSRNTILDSIRAIENVVNNLR